jgi:NitT/TauT family transport system ATP-binding protein
LSGGMQQRVAIARAIAFRPEILLLDEPFASVDALTRAELEDLVLRLQAKFKITVLLVTHDIDEAVYLADRVFVLGPPPSVVIRAVTVELPSPRSQTETRSDPRFLEIRNEIHDLITKEAQDTKDIEEENTAEAGSPLSNVD